MLFIKIENIIRSIFLIGGIEVGIFVEYLNKDIKEEVVNIDFKFRGEIWVRDR